MIAKARDLERITVAGPRGGFAVFVAEGLVGVDSLVGDPPYGEADS